MSVPRGRYLVLVVTLVAATFGIATGCGGGDGDDDDPSPTCVSFVGAAAPAPSTVAVRSDAGGSCDQAVVEFVITDVADVYAVGADVTYDTDVVEFESLSTAGSVLASDGATLATQVKEPTAGTVTVGVGRVGATAGVTVNGTARLFRMTFRKVADSGTGALSLSDELVQNGEEPPETIPGIPWSGGTFRIQ
jgi:hypothetical protein